MTPSSIGLALASATSLSNVGLDVFRKKALDGSSLLRTTFWQRAATTALITLVVLVRWCAGHPPHFWSNDMDRGILSFLPPAGVYFFYLLLDSAIIALNMLLYNRAVQTSPLSLTVPFLSFTPVFLLGTGYVILGEIPGPLECEGILFVVLGSVLMHRRSFLKGIFEPFRIIIRERGSRYMLAVSLLFAISNPIEKKLVQFSDSYTFGWSYAMMSALIFAVPLLVQRASLKSEGRGIRPRWIALTSLTDALTLNLQLATLKVIDVVICIAIKRAGILLTVLAGWLIFREKDIADRLIAAAVMMVGALMVYLPMSLPEQLALTVMTLAGLSFTLLATRSRARLESA
jgi:drug/metabolite transporter (DMT)-like permease